MKTVKQVLILIGVAVVLGGVVNLVHPKRIAWAEDWEARVEAQAVQEGIPLVQLSEMIDILREHSHVLIDARPTVHYDRGHIPGAVSVPFGPVEVDGVLPIELLRAGPGLVFYCFGPESDDSLLLAIATREIGQEDVAVFIGGMELWTSELLAVEEETE